MKEELFVETQNGFDSVDLNEPSGIQLNYKSNLFGDLSKVTCSHSYTFKLPMTGNNRRIFDFAEDIRHQSTMIRRRLRASYLQNGIQLFANANLYIESVGSTYNAIMTWDVIGGLTTLKDNDISLRRLPNDNTETMFGSVIPQTEDEAFDNTDLVLHPLYDCGIPFYRWNLPYIKTSGRRTPSRSTGFGAYPMPVVPVFRLLQMINSHFGTKFKLGDCIGIGDAKKYDSQREVVEKGVVPLVAADLNYEERLKRKCYLAGIRHTYVDTTIKEENELHFNDVITFNSIVIGQPDDYLDAGTLSLARHDVTGTTYTNAGIKPKIDGISVEVDGCLQVSFTDFPSTNNNADELPVLSVYQRQMVWKSQKGGASGVHGVRYYEWVELDSVEGESIMNDGGYKIFEFDFAQENGSSRMSCENLKSNAGSLIFVFSHRIKSIYSMQKDIEVFLINILLHRIDTLDTVAEYKYQEYLFYAEGY